MTYVTDQTSSELCAHMRKLKAMPGWHEPLADRLWKEVQDLTLERDALRAALQDNAVEVRGELTDDDLDKIDTDAKAEANQNPEGTQYHWRKAYLRAFARNLLAAQPAPVVPDGWVLVQTTITEEMHVAACKVLTRANGMGGLPQRMLDAMLAASQQKGGQ